MRIAPFGPRALVVDLDSTDQVLALADWPPVCALTGLTELIRAERSLTLAFDVPNRLDAAIATIERWRPERGSVDPAIVHEVEVIYDGEDLDAVADALGLSGDAVIAQHTGHEWTAAFTGFAPGFSYLVSAGAGLELPRRAEPRTLVPAGSVAIAGRYSGIYPSASPGGWHLLGRTDSELWNPLREPPALVRAGDRVRFVAVAEFTDRRGRPRAALSRSRASDPARAVEIVSPGLQSLIEDAGRPGHLHDAVPGSGAADRASWLAGNELVGNRFGAAAIETVFGGLSVRAHGDLVVALTGSAPGGVIAGVDGERTVAAWTPVKLRAGEVLQLLPSAGVRSYLAVRGGIATPPVLGSRSMDVLTGLGGPPLATGDLLPIGTDAGGAVDPLIPRLPVPTGALQVPVALSHRASLFTAEALEALESTSWEVGADSNRVGVRLVGPVPLRTREPLSLPSEGMLPGALQVPPTGMPVIFLRDHPATGGYPIIAIVDASGLDGLGRLAPGARLRFVVV